MALPQVHSGVPRSDKRDDEIRRLSSQIRLVSQERDRLTKELQSQIDALKAENDRLRKLCSQPKKIENKVQHRNFDRNRTCFVELGRYGDIINILPLVRDKYAETGIKPVVAVSQGFDDLFECVSYADALPLPLKTTEVLPAIDEANVRFENVIVSQIYGIKYDPGKLTESYNKESWRLSGYLDRWDDPSLRLVFDRRNYARERSLIKNLIPATTKPIVLVNLSGHSSPFAKKTEFQTRLFKRRNEEVALIDISETKAGNLVDLVGLMELSDLMITTDTATLHLAAATSVPVVALLSDGMGWRQSAPRCNCVLKFTAGEWESNAAALDSVIVDTVAAVRSRRVIHAFERHENDDPRVLRAQESWKRTGWTLAPYEEYVRDARDIGDPRALPYLRDVLENALKVAKPSDYIVLTNDDNGLADDADGEVRRVLSGAVMATGRRFDPDDQTHMGRDIIAFRAGWLKHNLDLIPDFILGAPQWDLWAASFARKLCGLSWSHETSHVEQQVCEIRAGAVTHEAHESYWSKHENDPSAKHNDALRRVSK